MDVLKFKLFIISIFAWVVGISQTTYSSFGGAIQLEEPYYIESMLTSYDQYVNNVKVIGYSIQLKSANNKDAVETLFTEVRANSKYIKLAPRLDFESPYFKLRLGYYLDKKLATKDLMELRKQFPEAIIVSSKFPLKNCNER